MWTSYGKNSVGNKKKIVDAWWDRTWVKSIIGNDKHFALFRPQFIDDLRACIEL